MRNSISSLFSYIFMTSAFVSVSTALCLIVILLRYIGDETTDTEMAVARYFLFVLVISAVLTPLSLFVSDKLGKISRRKGEV
ncbi:MAG TPA: hypothetical protein VLB01_06755 [Thermodesulfobacteriota bacterium]|nr:hypothetical protein [Thermodesulfobacteriota bacterium]